MINKELIEQYRKIVKPIIASRLLKTNYEGMGEQDKEEFERDFDEILDYALIGLKYKNATKDATSDLISRQAVSSWLKQYGQDVLHGKYKLSLMYIWKNLMDLPAAQPERKTGHWIRYDKRFPWRFHYKCSECGNYLDFSGINAGRGSANFCPNCGAKMENRNDT